MHFIPNLLMSLLFNLSKWLLLSLRRVGLVGPLLNGSTIKPVFLDASTTLEKIKFGELLPRENRKMQSNKSEFIAFFGKDDESKISNRLYSIFKFTVENGTNEDVNSSFGENILLLLLLLADDEVFGVSVLTLIFKL